MQLFDEVMKGFKTVFDDGIKKPLKGVTRESRAAADSLDGLEKSIAGINKATDKPIQQFQSNWSKLGKAVGNAAAAAGAAKIFGDQILKYNDAARMAARGTALLGRSVGDTDAAIESLHRYGAAIKAWSGFTVEESMKLGASMQGDFMRSTRIDLSREGAAVGKYTEDLQNYQKAAGLGAVELEKYHNTAIAQANMTLGESQDLLRHVAAASTEFGLAGPESVQILIDSMETANALEADERQQFLKLQIEAGAAQKKASVEFGKYVSEIGKKKGTDAFKEYAKIAALTGKTLDQVANTFRGTDAAKKMQLQQEYVGKFGSLDRYQELLGKATAGKLGGGEASEMMQMEMRHKSLLDGLNLTIEDVLTGKNKIDEGRFADDPNKKLNIGVDNLNKSLETAADMASRFEAEIQLKTLKGLELLGVDANDAAGALRKITAIYDQKGFGAGAAFAGLFGARALGLDKLLLGGLGKLIPGLGGAGAAGAGAGGTGAAGGMGAFASKAGPIAWAAAMIADAGYTGYQLTSKEGRDQVKSDTDWNFSDSGTDQLKSVGRAVIRPIQTITGAMMKQEEAYQSAKSVIAGWHQEKELTEKLRIRAEARGPVTINEGEAQAQIRRSKEEFRKRLNAMSDEQLAANGQSRATVAALNAAAERSMGSGTPTATNVKQTATTIKEVVKQEKQQAQDPTAEIAKTMQRFAEQPNTVPVLSEIRDLLSQILMNGPGIA